MGRVKGCMNESCLANQKSITYKEENDYCSKCGNKLYNVCKKCYTQLPDNAAKYCVRCLAEKQDRKDKAKDHARKIGGGIVATIGIAASIAGEKAIKNIPKFK
jgi:hypothetical protein